MLLLNHKLTSEEALNFNFVSKIYNSKLESEIWTKLVEFSKLPQESLKVGKKLIKNWNIEILDKVVIAEIDALKERWNSDEFFNAITNFMSKKSKL